MHPGFHADAVLSISCTTKTQSPAALDSSDRLLFLDDIATYSTGEVVDMIEVGQARGDEERLPMRAGPRARRRGLASAKLLGAHEAAAAAAAAAAGHGGSLSLCQSRLSKTFANLQRFFKCFNFVDGLNQDDTTGVAKGARGCTRERCHRRRCPSEIDVPELQIVTVYHILVVVIVLRADRDGEFE